MPNPPSPAERDSASEEDYIVLVWSGSNPGTQVAVQEALEHENIPTRVLRREDTILPLAHSAIEIYVPSSFAQKASETLNKLDPSGDSQMPADAEDTGDEIPAEDDLPETRTEYRDFQPWNAEGATVQLWDGQDTDLADMIRACLRENRIPSRSSRDDAESDTATKSAERLYVLPEDEARAKEIVREIVDAVPPQ